MVELTTVVFVLVGLGLLFFGAALSSYGVTALGLLIGGGSGYFIGGAIASFAGVSATAAIAGAAIVGAAVGLIASFFLLSLAVAGISFIVGTYLGLTVLASYLVDGGTLIEVPVALGIGLVFAGVGWFLTKTMMVFLASFVGAILASTQVTMSDLTAAANEPHYEPLLVDATAPLFLGLLVLGILVQFGLFKLGYVAKVPQLLPGVKPLRDRGEESEA